MYSETLQKLESASKTKLAMLESSFAKYFIAALLAGLYVGLGICLIMTIGGLGKPLGGLIKIVMGLSFGIALSLVIMAGSELFTGNNLIMTAGALNKGVSWKGAVGIWGASYIGNLAGSILCGTLFFLNTPSEAVSDFITNLSAAKMGLSPMVLIFKGIMCNMLVCLAVLCCVRMKDESAKLTMIFLCLFAFITSGYSHSIANMTLFTTGLLLPHGADVSLGGAAYNLLWVTIGNMIGGCSLGWAYWFMGKSSNKLKEAS